MNRNKVNVNEACLIALPACLAVVIVIFNAIHAQDILSSD
jgi:hypothetical protein